MMNQNDRYCISLTDIRERYSSLSQHSSFNLDQECLNCYETICNRLNIDQQTKYFPNSLPYFINNSSDCRNCYYGFQIDTYTFGCTHDCIYCWAKTELTKTDSWNSPFPIPIDITLLWEAFYLVFEKNSEHPLKKVMIKKIPLRIGSMSDPFLKIETKFKVTKNLIKLLNHYNYPFVMLTRSDLVAEDEYLNLLKKENATIQLSIPSLNENLVSILEPGAPSPTKRINALKKLHQNNIWTTVRINPLFPNFPDKTLTLNLDLKNLPHLDFYSKDLLKEIAQSGCKSVLVGFVHLDSKTTKSISDQLKIDLTKFLSSETSFNGSFIYSRNEIKLIYQKIYQDCSDLNLQFTTCYLGLGENYFWQDKPLWEDVNDCCNLKNNVENFNTNSLNVLPHQWKTGKITWKDFLFTLEHKLYFFILSKIFTKKSKRP